MVQVWKAVGRILQRLDRFFTLGAFLVPFPKPKLGLQTFKLQVQLCDQEAGSSATKPGELVLSSDPGGKYVQLPMVY